MPALESKRWKTMLPFRAVPTTARAGAAEPPAVMTTTAAQRITTVRIAAAFFLCTAASNRNGPPGPLARRRFPPTVTLPPLDGGICGNGRRMFGRRGWATIAVACAVLAPASVAAAAHRDGGAAAATLSAAASPAVGPVSRPPRPTGYVLHWSRQTRAGRELMSASGFPRGEAVV